MTDAQKQATTPDAKESLTLWLPAGVIENLNELVIRRSSRRSIVTKSDVVAELINKAHRGGTR